MTAGLAATNSCRSVMITRRSLMTCSARLRSEISAQEPTISNGRPASSYMTLKVSWIQIVPAPVPEAVFDSPASLLNQRIHFGKDSFAILRVKTARPELWVLKHFPRGIAHYQVDILADERTRVIARGSIRVQDSSTNRHKVLQPLAVRLQFGSTVFDPSFKVVVRLLERFLRPFALAQV